jgi:phenylacetic acid degradation operon negative regulatory protein
MDDQLRRRSVGAPAARSMLLTVLGEYVLPAGGSAWQETLVAALAALDYKQQAARQALARSAGAGWLRAERHGRRARMHLSDPTAGMLSAGAERIYGFGAPWVWDGRWLLVVLRVPEERREVRHQLRTRLAWAGFGSLGGGVWITPHVSHEDELRGAAENGSVAAMLSFQAELGALGDPDRVIREAWDLDTIAEHYLQFIADFGRARPTSPEAMFRAQTAMVHAWRKFPFLDPDLPAQLLPRGWPLRRAHELFHDRHDRWHEAAQSYFRSLMDPSSRPGSTGSGRTRR